MKLLIITYSYAPDLTPRAFRWSAVARQFVRMGHEVHLLCAAPAAAAVDDDVIVYRVRDWLINASARVAPGTAPARQVAAPGHVTRVRAWLRRAIRAVWRSLFWPDYACGWVIPATRVARSLCAVNRYDWIISVSHPFTGHLVGLLAKARAPHSRWLVDIGDPFHLMKEPSPNNRLVYGWLNALVETSIVRRADTISVTTDATRQLYESSFSLPDDKVRVVPPLLSLPVSPPPSLRASDAVIRLVFVGTLYRKLRSPGFLLACFAELVARLPGKALELHFYGAVNDCAGDLDLCSDRVKSSLFMHGTVARSEVLQAMVDATVLVNIGNNSESQLASKVIEYMAAGRPILNLISVPQDASVEALADHPSLLNIMRTNGAPTGEIMDALCEFVSRPPLVPNAYVDSVRQRYSAVHVAGLYETILERQRHD
jgi:glycosyltransferase involved in cell wall biosynthesis